MLAGRPLFAWSLEAVIGSACFDDIVVASDSADIRTQVRAEFGTAVTVTDRARDNADDAASSEAVMLEIIEHYPCDVMALVQATSPLTVAGDLRAARAQFEHQQLDSLLTAVRSHRFFWSPQGLPLNYDPAARPRRQDFAGSLVENGAFYYIRVPLLKTTHCRLAGRIGIYEMPAETDLEIDEPGDLERARQALEARASGRTVTDTHENLQMR